MRKRHLLTGVLATSLALSLAGGNLAMAQEAKELKIAYSIPQMFSTFWAACMKGFEDQCEAYGYEAVTLDPNGDTELQMSQLLNQATTGADAIVISPIEKDTIGPTVDQINAQGIPVFCIDRKGSGDVVSMLTTDNYQAGVDMAKQMIADYGEEFKLLIVQGVLSDQPTIDRTAGVEDTIKEYPGIELVGDPSAGEYSEEAAMSRKVLRAAAMTYVASFLMSLLQFLRFFALLLMARNRRD